MGDILNQKRNLWVFWVIFLVAVAVLFVVWFITFSASAWDATTNYLQMYLEFIVTNPINAFFTVSTGPGGTVSWTFIPVYIFTVLHVGLYFYQKHKNLDKPN